MAWKIGKVLLGSVAVFLVLRGMRDGFGWSFWVGLGLLVLSVVLLLWPRATSGDNTAPKSSGKLLKNLSTIAWIAVAIAIVFGIGSCAFKEIRQAQNFSNSVRREFIEVPSVYNEKRVWVKNNEPYTLHPDCKRWDVGTLGGGNYKVVYPKPDGDSIIVEAHDAQYENHIELPSYPDACGYPWVRLYPLSTDSVHLWVRTIP